MESFTFFDYSGLDQDEAASIKLFLEFASNEKGIIYEPQISLPNPSNKSNNKDNNDTKPIHFGDDINTIEENTFEFLNLPQPSKDSLDECLSAQINNIPPLNENMKNEISLESIVSSEPISSKNNISSWSGLFHSNKSNHQNSNFENIKSYSEIDKEFVKDDKDYPALENLIKTSEPNERKMPFTIIPINEDPLSPTIKRVLEIWPNFNERISLKYVPRPLINEGNWCYVNSVLQALLCLPPFYSLFSRLGTAATTNNPPNISPQKSSAPVTLVLSQFVYHNYVVDNKQTTLKIAQPSTSQNAGSLLKTNQTLNVAPAVKPSEIYDILPTCISSDFSGKQEDAEELLSSVLNAMHEEMSRALTNQTPTGYVTDHVTAGTEEEEWEKVGRKGKSTLTRETKIPKSPISAMFGGILRSNVQHQCCKGSANLQPFFVLPLDIQPGHVRNLNDALRHTFAKEHLPDYYCPKSKNSIDAYRILQIETVPEILVFQIKSFVFNSQDGTSKKLLKSLIFPQTLDLNKEILSRPSSLTRNYQLRSVIYHVGKSIQGGHYVTSFKQNDNDPDDWYLADDAIISRVKLDEITSTFLANKENYKPAHKQPGRQGNQNNVTPYLLFYTKCGQNESKKGQ